VGGGVVITGMGVELVVGIGNVATGVVVLVVGRREN